MIHREAEGGDSKSKGVRMHENWENCDKRTKDERKHDTTIGGAKKDLKSPFALSRTGNFGKRSISKKEKNITDETRTREQ